MKQFLAELGKCQWHLGDLWNSIFSTVLHIGWPTPGKGRFRLVEVQRKPSKTVRKMYCLSCIQNLAFLFNRINKKELWLCSASILGLNTRRQTMYSHWKMMLCISVKAFLSTHKWVADSPLYVLFAPTQAPLLKSGTCTGSAQLYTPHSAENLQNGIRHDAFLCASSLCVGYVVGAVVQKSHRNVFGSVGQDFYIWKWELKRWETYGLKTMAMLNTSIHPIIPQQDLSSRGTQTCSCLLQLHYWKEGLFILPWILHAIQVLRRKTSSIAWAVFVCLVLSLSAKEAVFINSGEQGAPRQPGCWSLRWLYPKRPVDCSAPEACPDGTEVMTIGL